MKMLNDIFLQQIIFECTEHLSLIIDSGTATTKEIDE